MHDVINNKSPINISSLFTSVTEVHNYNYRSAARGNFYQPRSRLNVQAKSFCTTGVNV